MPIVQGKMDKLCSFIVRHRVIIFLFVLVGAGLFSSGAAKIKSEVVLGELFPYDHPYLKLHAKFAQVFGTGASAAVIAVHVKDGDIFNADTLEKIKNMTYEIEMWDETYRILTTSMASKSIKVTKSKARGEITFEALMFPHVPKTAEDMEALKTNIFSSPDLNGILVSEEGTAAMIITMFKEDISYEKSFELLRALQAKYSDDNHSVHVIGYPMLMGWIYSYKNQMYVVFALSVVFMFIILYAIFRNLVGMIAPMALAIICTGLGLGFVGWIQLNFNPLLFVLAFLVAARMVSNAVQITHRYIEEYRLSRDREEAAFKTMRAMWMPNAAAVATDAAGFLVLIIAKIALMQMIAIMMSFWMLTIVISGMLVPIMCSFLPMKADNLDAKERRESGWLAQKLEALADFSVGKGKYVVGFLVGVIVVVGISQTTQLKVGDPSPGSSILWPSHPYNQDQGLINRLFKSSSDNLALYYEGTRESIYDPEVMLTFEKFDRYMAEKLPDIYKSSSSIIGMAKAVHIVFRDGDQAWYQLPRGEVELTGLIGILINKAASVQLRRFMDIPEPSKRAQISLFFADHTSDNMLRVRDAAFNFFKENPMETKNGKFLLAGGRIGLEIALNEEMKSSHAQMDIAVLVTIFIMCSIAFRSFVAGAMLAIPLLLSNLMAFAYMAFANIGLSTNTLPCSAVGVGVGVDFAIYLYSRCIEEFPNHSDYKDTIVTAVKTAGSGIVFTGITLILPVIAWYFISGLKFQAQMGFFLAMLLFINMVASLTLHPLLIYIVKPKFMKKRAAARQAAEES
jgi:predicted RND superfamily exporter protein